MKQEGEKREKVNPLSKVQVESKAMSYPRKLSLKGILCRAAGGDNDQVENDKKK